MRADALDIDRFYRTKPGQMVKDMVNRRLRTLWSDTQTLDLLGFGFTGPYLAPFREDARRTVSFMPASQGVVAWPKGQLNTAVLGDEHRLPFADAQFDRIILAHGLEEAQNIPKLLREIWRVLAPEGRLVVIAANRGGVWSLVDSTPFGHGRPFTRRQLNRALEETLFEPTAFSRAVYALPWRWSSSTHLANIFENFGEKLFPVLGGLILVEAVKHVGAIRSGGQRVHVHSTPALKTDRQTSLPTQSKRLSPITKKEE